MKCLFLLFVLCLCGAAVTPAATWIVAQDGSGDFIAIQDAIDYAQSGDEIIVHVGIYVENVDYLGKDLWVHSASGPAGTIIDGSGGAPDAATCVTFQSGESREAILEGFTVTGGEGSVPGDRVVGGGVVCNGASPTLRDCWIVDNRADSGAGVFLSAAAPAIRSCRFEDNLAYSLGGALHGASTGSNPDVEDCVFADNIAGWGGGAMHLSPANGSFRGCTFERNSAGTGGAISLDMYGPGADYTDCTFQGNVAFNGHGGAIRLHESSATIEWCLFLGNTASQDGGGLFVMDGSAPTVANCTFYENGAGRYGGNVAIWSDSAPTISNCIVARATQSGGVFCSDATGYFDCNDAWANVGGNYVGCYDPTGTDGNISEDPLFCDPGAGDFTLQECSPCAPFTPPNPECDLIGARLVGCGGTPVAETTWGALKVMFGR